MNSADVTALRVQRGQRVLDAVLHHVVAALILPQKLSRRVAMVIASERSGVACTSTGTLRPDKPDRVHDAALFAEIGQRNDDAVDLFRVLLEQFGAMLRLSVGFHCAVLRFLGPEHDRRRSRGLKHGNDFFSAGLGQMIRKESAISYNHSKCHLSLRCHFSCSFSMPHSLA